MVVNEPDGNSGYLNWFWAATSLQISVCWLDPLALVFSVVELGGHQAPQCVAVVALVTSFCRQLQVAIDEHGNHAHFHVEETALEIGLEVRPLEALETTFFLKIEAFGASILCRRRHLARESTDAGMHNVCSRLPSMLKQSQLGVESASNDWTPVDSAVDSHASSRPGALVSHHQLQPVPVLPLVLALQAVLRARPYPESRQVFLDA